MTNAELDAETRKVFAAAPTAAFQFQSFVMVWVKTVGRERAKECLVKAVDVMADANDAYNRSQA